MQNKKLIYFLIALFATAPCMGAVVMPQNITQEMVNKAACEVARGYKKSNAIRAVTFFGGSAAALSAVAYHMMNSRLQDAAAKPESLKVPATMEGMAAALDKLVSHHSDSDGFIGSMKNFAKTMVAIVTLSYAWDTVKGWFLAPQRYSNVEAFVDANTAFNLYKNTIERKTEFRDASIATADDIEYLSHLYAQLCNEVVKICGYMQFRIASYLMQKAPADDMLPFVSVLRNVVAITSRTNQQLSTMLSSSTATLEDILYAMAKYAGQIDIECGAFKIYETSYSKQGGF